MDDIFPETGGVGEMIPMEWILKVVEDQASYFKFYGSMLII